MQIAKKTCVLDRIDCSPKRIILTHTCVCVSSVVAATVREDIVFMQTRFNIKTLKVIMEMNDDGTLLANGNWILDRR